MIIYKATNTVNGKVYIGQTTTALAVRKRNHKSDALNDTNNRHFYNAIRKYGWDSFKWEVIDTAKTQEELDKKEIYWITNYDSYNNGYNNNLGGGGNSGYQMPRETVRQVVESMGKLRPIIVYDMNGNKVGEFDLIRWAEDDLGMVRGQLWNVLHGNSYTATGTNGNYTAMYSDEYTHDAMLAKIAAINNKTINRGEDNTFAKLTEEQVLTIKKMIVDEVSYNVIADTFNVFIGTISCIARGQTWSYLELPPALEKQFQDRIASKKFTMLNDEIVKQIRIKYINGASTSKLAKEYRIAERNMHRIKMMESYPNVVVEGYDPRAFSKRPIVTQETRRKIRQLISQGVKHKDISEQLGVSLNTIGREKRKMKAGK